MAETGKGEYIKRKLRFGATNLKKYFGLPAANKLDWWDHWMDHYFIHRVGGRFDDPSKNWSRVELVSEPYQISNDGIEKIKSMCLKYKLHWIIEGGAVHHPKCIHIVIWRENENPPHFRKDKTGEDTNGKSNHLDSRANKES